MITSTGLPPPRYEPTRGLALWGTDEVQAALEVVRSRSLFRYYGPDLQHRADRFEQDLASTVGTRHAIAVSSGTAALACALVGLGMPAGAEVIIPALTFVGCVNAISWARGVPQREASLRAVRRGSPASPWATRAARDLSRQW